MDVHRRRMLELTVGFAFAGGSSAKAALQAPSARTLSLANLHTGEALTATYWEAGAYVPDALTALNHLLRDYRTGDVHPIAPGVLDVVASLRGRLETNAAVQIISGYRSPATNAALHSRSDGVASHSLHMLGEAIDLRIPGVDLARLRDAAWSLQRGGVGYYPAQFVHVDVGRVRRW